jgi:RND family efflux transporter MFP subunit
MLNDLAQASTQTENCPPTNGTGRHWAEWLLWAALLPGVGLLGAVLSRFVFAAGACPLPPSSALTVEVISPTRTKLARTFEQAGTVRPFAQVELYAKASGYLMYIRREVDPAVAASLFGQALMPFSNHGSRAGGLAASVHAGPQIDIGSHVQAGDLLMEVDVPERQQAVDEALAAHDQRCEEYEQSRRALKSFDAALTLARAHRDEAISNVERARSAHELAEKQLARVRDLAERKAIEPSTVDEKAAEERAACSAWVSSKARRDAARAEVDLAQSKLDVARGDVRVKDTKVRAAASEVNRARVLASYGRLYAPFSGRITFRDVDEGDFVQNSRTGQLHHLLTVTASRRVKVVVQVPSREGMLVHAGAKAEITVDERPGERYYGHVTRTRGQFDTQSRTHRVEIDLRNRNGQLVPGMYAHVRLTLAETPTTWVVPASALLSRKKVNYLIVVEDGVVHRQPVRILFDSGSFLEVVKLVGGKEVRLDGKESLVVSGKGALADGQPVRAVQRPVRH